MRVRLPGGAGAQATDAVCGIAGIGAIAVDDIVEEPDIPGIDEVPDDAACDVVDDVAEPQPLTVSARAIANAPTDTFQARRNVCIERLPNVSRLSGNYTREHRGSSWAAVGAAAAS